MKKKKEINFIVEFDDKEYSYEECIYLYKRFFEALSTNKKIEIPEEFLKKVFPPSFFEEHKE